MEVTDTANTSGLLSALITERNAPFQSKINENKDVIFFPTQVHQCPESYP